MNKKLLIIIIAILSLLFVYKNVYALDTNEEIEDSSYGETHGKYEVVIEDNANLLSDEEVESLKDSMSKLTEYGNIAFVTINTNTTTTSDYARNYYHSKFGTESGSVFIIDMYNRQIYIFSDGYNYNVITKSKSYIITDNTYRYATNQDYYHCAEETFKEMYTLLDGGKILEPMRHISNAVLALVAAFFINFIIVLRSSKLKRAKAKEILKYCDINFNVANIVGTQVGTHRVYSPVSDSSSGGSSGGGGGGGSSGGGGGHSF